MFGRRKEPSPPVPTPTNVEMVDFLYYVDTHRDSILKLGFDKNRVPYVVKCRESGSVIYIEYCSPLFHYNSFSFRGQLRYDRKDQLKDRLWISFVDVPDKYVSQGIGTAIMEGIIRYAGLAGVSTIEGEQRWQSPEQKWRQEKFYHKFRFDFHPQESPRKVYICLDMNKWIFEED